MAYAERGGAIEDLPQLLVGRIRVESSISGKGCGDNILAWQWIVRSTAISGIDVALWDISGSCTAFHATNLGGPVRDLHPSVLPSGGGKMEHFYETPVDNAATIRRACPQGCVGRLHRV